MFLGQDPYWPFSAVFSVRVYLVCLYFVNRHRLLCWMATRIFWEILFHQMLEQKWLLVIDIDQWFIFYVSFVLPVKCLRMQKIIVPNMGNIAPLLGGNLADLMLDPCFNSILSLTYLQPILIFYGIPHIISFHKSLIFHLRHDITSEKMMLGMWANIEFYMILYVF